MQLGEETIALVGSINRDTICTLDGVQVESYGGMLYGILSLAQISSATVFPVGVVGTDVQTAVMSLLDGCSQINLSGLRFTSHQNPHCVLTYDDEGNKQEVLCGGVPPIDFEQIEPFLDCRAVCVNFITGTELSLDTMKKTRRSRTGPIFMDVHSLTLTTGDENRRYLCKPRDWESWVACADFVQCNENEASLLADEPMVEKEAVARFGERILGLGPVGLLITRGSRGSQTVSRSASGQVEIRSYGAIPGGAVVDETGCGDVFLMGFVWEYLKSADLETASEFANKVAGINCCLRGIEEIGQMGRFLEA
jgi:sugar/nucleoside kinase (ribokinase family)